jgi:hypothetical protein
MTTPSFGKRFLDTLADMSAHAFGGLYADAAVLYTPLAGASRGRAAIKGYFDELRSGFPGLRVALHDEFTSADGGRASVRLHLDWQNTGSFRDQPATGQRGESAETHSFRFEEGLVVEHFLGVSSFQMPKLFLVDLRLEFPREIPDPALEILSRAPEEPRATDEHASLAQRFTDAFGRREVAALRELYAEDVVLYTPLGWPVEGREALESFALEFHAANPGMRIALHDEFYSADGARACWRIRLHYHNTEAFYGNQATGDAGTMTETHLLRVADDRIVEHVVGDNTFHMPYQELVLWRMPFPETTPDPSPEIASIVVGGELVMP